MRVHEVAAARPNSPVLVGGEFMSGGGSERMVTGSAQASTPIVATIIDQRHDSRIQRVTFHLQREQPMSMLFTRVQRENQCAALACTYLSHVTGLTCVLPHNTPATLMMRALESVTMTITASLHASRKRSEQPRGDPGGDGAGHEEKSKQAGAIERPDATTAPDAGLATESPEPDELGGYNQRNKGGSTAREVHHHRGFVPPPPIEPLQGAALAGAKSATAGKQQPRVCGRDSKGNAIAKPTLLVTEKKGSPAAQRRAPDHAIYPLGHPVCCTRGDGKCLNRHGIVLRRATNNDTKRVTQTKPRRYLLQFGQDHKDLESVDATSTI